MRQLSREEINEVLENTGYGFLGLARDNHPYVIPLSYGFDGDELYFQMNSQGRKYEFIDGKTPVCLTVLRIDQGTGESESILIEGELQEVAEEDTGTAYDALASTANFGADLSIWGIPLEDAELTFFALHPRNISGRVFGEQ